MSLPHVLLVDDSEAILAFESAALASHCRLSTAPDGEQALEKLRLGGVELVVLDLSMPVMNGDEVLARMQADPSLAQLPVVIVSSEKERAQALLGRGAAAFLHKPIRADALLQTVVRELEAAARRRRAGALSYVQLEVGGVSLGVPLTAVHRVVPQCLTTPVAGGPAYLSEMFTLAGEPVLVLDLAERLGVSHRASLAERKLVVLAEADVRIALCVDAVHDPEELEAAQVSRPGALGGADFGPLAELLIAVAHPSGAAIPVLDPAALVSREKVKRLSAALFGEAALG
jgi:CheY-like chemotaxis protein